MSFMRDTLIVGGATFIVGSVLMEIGVEKEGKGVGWWPYVGTFISGALGFYLVTSLDLVQVKDAEYDFQNQAITTVVADDEEDAWENFGMYGVEEDWAIVEKREAEGRSHLHSFMAEVFEAERKARRRTALTWTRGLDPNYADNFTKHDEDGFTRPYDVYAYYLNRYYSDDNAYHVKGLPEGYAMHLWKPLRRKNRWRMKLKSPHTDGWQDANSFKKKGSVQQVLAWYNDQIAIPEKKTLSPIEAMMQQQGLVSSGITIKRVEPTPGKFQFFYEGGEEGYAPTLFMTQNRDDLKFDQDESNMPSELHNFCRGMIYLDNVNTLRSVNRYNADRTQWVKSKPAWFQNMCATGINTLYATKGTETWQIDTSYDDWQFVNFKKGGLQVDGVERGTFEVYLPTKALLEGDEEEEYEWVSPRPSTQRKMYQSASDEIEGRRLQAHIFKECVKKYNPQKFKEVAKSMTSGGFEDNPDGFTRSGSNYPEVKEALQIMCRRFKKNEK